MYWWLWICVFAYRENHEWYLIQSPRLPPAVPQSLTPALCPWTMLPSLILHYRLPQVHSVHRPTHNAHCFLGFFCINFFIQCHLRSYTFRLLVCVYLNKYGKMGPHLDQRRIQQLPDHFGPGRASSVLQQCVQACVDSAHNQGTVFSCLKSGQGGEVISGVHWSNLKANSLSSPFLLFDLVLMNLLWQCSLIHENIKNQQSTKK